MKKLFSLTILSLFVISSVYWGCTKEKQSIPSVNTSAVTGITDQTASCGGEIGSDGGTAITAKGVCWSKQPNPTIADTKTQDGTGSANFSSKLTGLQAGVVYHVRAYATNALGTAYGNDMTFSSKSTAPVVTSSSASEISSVSVTLGGNIISDGGAAVTASGICWAATAMPTTSNSKTTDGAVLGVFASKIANLTSGTTYHYRAYATNSLGTSYGADSTFTTTTFPTLKSATVSYTMTTANISGSVLSNGGASIIERGIYWSTNPTPSISDNKIKDNTQTNTFTVSITGLTANTTYYARTYAKNNVGVTYSEVITFKTYGLKDIDGNLYHELKLGSQTWMGENLRTKHFSNGDSIGTTYPSNKDITGMTNAIYQWPAQNDEAHVQENGRYYTGYAVVDSRNVCPTGWHVSTNNEWMTLINALGGNTIAGGRLKETGTSHWPALNVGATNDTGFDSFPVGFRYANGDLDANNAWDNKWTTTNGFNPNQLIELIGRSTFSWDAGVGTGSYSKLNGLTVRCVKN